MATFDLGRVTPLYKGDYSASASYELNDVVLYNGNLYWHVQATATVGILPTDTTVWKLAFADEGVRAEIRGYADDAQTSKTAAAQSASQASASASSAQASASQAALSAQAAGTSEGNASASASAAATSATNSAVSAQSAASEAQTATDKATLATNKAQAASESASLATAKANAAATSETNAAASAQTATVKASEAAASATSAQEYDESAQQSAVNAQTAQTAAETAQTAAETAQTAAETAQGLAEDARDEAQQIKDDVEDAIADKADSAEIGDLSQLTTTAKTDLVSAVTEVNGRLGGLKSAIEHGYIDTPPTSQGGFAANGTLNTTNPRRIRTELIPVEVGDKIVIHNGGTLGHACGAWNGTPSSETVVRNDNTFNYADETIVSEIAGYYVIAFAKTDTTQNITLSEFDGYIHLYANAIYKNTVEIDGLKTRVSTVENSVNNAVTVVNTPVYDNIETAITKAQGYYGANNTFSDNASYEHTQIIPVETGDIITPVSTNPSATFRFVTAYRDGTCIIPAGSGSAVGSYTVPENINGVRFSFYASTGITAVTIKRRTGTETVYYPLTQGLGYVNWKGDLASGQSVELLGTNVRFNTVWCFTGHISTMGKITLAVKTTGGTVKELCSVDATNIYYRLQNGNTASVAHGLTIAEDLQIRIDSPFKVNELGGITICSDGVEYTLPVTPYGTDMNGVPYLLSTGAVMTDCAFSWIPKDIDKPIWVFGDSWVSMYDTRWPYYMVRDGFTNTWMLNGFAGEDTDEAYESLENLLTIRKPDYIVWLLGMNNGDSSTAVNSVWKAIYDKLVQLCEDYSINLILYTVPNTPTINNNFKNAIVRESGYRYIDGVSAVGDDGNGNWFTGYEQSSSDHNHTSAKGARALYYRILTDFPEIAGNSL